MYINIGENCRARLRNGPAPNAKVICTIPNGTHVQSEFFDYLWRRVTWKEFSGYMPAKFLSAYDPSPILWQQRYGAKSDSIHFCSSTSEQIIRFKTDLSNFFSPYQHQLDASCCYDKATEEAVLRFQLIYGLLMDGIAGPKTKAALMAYLPNRYR